MRAHGRVGASAYRLVCAKGKSGTIRFLELPRTRTKPQSEHEVSTEQASRTNVSGQCEVIAKCERTLELPQNADTGAPRTDTNDGGKDGQNITIMLKYKYKSFLEE